MENTLIEKLGELALLSGSWNSDELFIAGVGELLEDIKNQALSGCDGATLLENIRGIKKVIEGQEQWLHSEAAALVASGRAVWAM